MAQRSPACQSPNLYHQNGFMEPEKLQSGFPHYFVLLLKFEELDPSCIQGNTAHLGYPRRELLMHFFYQGTSKHRHLCTSTFLKVKRRP